MIQKLPQLSAPLGYRTQAIDISVEADLLDFYLLRQRSVTERLAIAAGLISSARELSLHCLSQQFSYLSQTELARKIADAWLQNDCPPAYIPSGSPMAWIQNSIELATQLHVLFEDCGIPYYVTGEVAAIAYGDPRTTRDLDIVIQIPPSEVSKLAKALEAHGFYVAGVDDVTSGRMQTLQVTQIETISRADIIVSEQSDYAQQQFGRRVRHTFPNGTEVYLASAEDVAISKLKWSSESEKQQRDVLAILKVQQDNLDYTYLHSWAERFGVLSVLEALEVAAGVKRPEE